MIFAPRALHFCYCLILVHFTGRSRGAEDENSSGAIGGPQASSGEDTNIVLDQGKLRYI
jgi:hypothetical protein